MNATHPITPTPFVPSLSDRLSASETWYRPERPARQAQHAAGQAAEPGTMQGRKLDTYA